MFLSYEISTEGISSDPNKVDIIKNWPEPTCTKNVKKYLGVLGYYRKSMENFACRILHAAPLTQLLKGELNYNGKMFNTSRFYTRFHFAYRY